MNYFGEFVYIVLAVLLIMFWRARTGRKIDDLLSASEQEHHHVHRVLNKYPLGGAWRQFKGWMAEAK
ncbi:MAG: hypothetical protein VX733_04190 [Candidatus Latescibacterota bacterium]|nr:hypothetical protein [Candidatus Latescibacterota bacterium]